MNLLDFFMAMLGKIEIVSQIKKLLANVFAYIDIGYILTWEPWIRSRTRISLSTFAFLWMVRRTSEDRGKEAINWLIIPRIYCWNINQIKIAYFDEMARDFDLKS